MRKGKVKKLGIIFSIVIVISLVAYAGPSASAEEPETAIKPISMVLEEPLEGQAVVPGQAAGSGNGWQNILSEGFEGAFPGVWAVHSAPDYTDAYWGKDDYNPHSGSYSAFCAKSGTAGVNPPNNYPNNMEARMIYGPFSLADATDAELSFHYWNKSQGPDDILVWAASIDGHWFHGYKTWGNTGGWRAMSFDLTNVHPLGNLCGQPEVWIEFCFFSNESTTDKGAFIDDVVLRKYVGEYEHESLDYFKITEGHGIKYHVTDEWGALDCNVWAVSQYFETDKPHKLDFVFTLIKEGTEGGYFANSSLGGEASRTIDSKNLTLFYLGYPVGNQGQFYRNLSLPRFFNSGDEWNTWGDKEYSVEHVGSQTVNGIEFSDSIKVTIDDSLNDHENLRGTGYFILARDIGIVKLVFNRTNGQTVLYEYVEHEQPTKHTISGTITESGVPVEGIIVQISNANWGIRSVTDSNGAFSIQAYGPDIVLRIGYDEDSDDVFEFDDPNFPKEYCVNNITSDITGLNIDIHPPGYAIIVAGRGGISTIVMNHCADNAYRGLHNLGFDDNHIYYLNSDKPYRDIDGDGDNEVDLAANLSCFTHAINDIRDKVKANPIPLVLYFIGHGDEGGDVFYFDYKEDPYLTDDDMLHSSQLNDRLGNFPLSRMLIIIEACYSGSFITEASVGDSISAKNRIIITAAHDYGWRGKRPTITFPCSSDCLWKNLNQGLTVKEAFIKDVGSVARWDDRHYSWLDDNGDKNGSPPHNLGKDGELAAITKIGVPITERLELTRWLVGCKCSPGEFHVYDSQNRVTGLLNGEVKEEIPGSIYDEENEIVAISSPFDTYRYEVVGTEEESYDLIITFVEDGEATTFTATDIPTTTGAIHDYTIDWDALSQGEEGVTVQVDSDGDGEFENSFTSDDELTQDEFLQETTPPPPPVGGEVYPPNKPAILAPWIALLAAIMAWATVILRRRRAQS